MEVNVSYIGRADNYYQSYTPDDLALLSSGIVTNPFGDDRLDYVENFIYDLNDNLLASNYFVNSYKPGNIDPVTGYYSSIVLDPETDVRNQGYDRGSIKVRYNFFRRLFKSSINQPFWIKEISTNRTEIRICRQDLANIELQQAFLEYDLQASSRAYYPDFYLNLGSNRLLIAVNVLYALQNGEGSLLVKLYEPLPEDINVKSTLWAVDKIAQSVEYSVSIEVPAQNVTVQNPLRGPNFSVALNEKVNQTTPLYNYSTLFNTSLSSSYQQLQSIMEEKGLDINVDYSDFGNFVHFSSATERLYNFVYKLELIEGYQADIDNLNSVASNNSSITSGSKTVLQKKIDAIIEKFDGYEYYLYFESSSHAWPKSTSSQPYSLYSVTSSQALSWLGGIEVEPTATSQSVLYTASLYDLQNKDNLTYSIPRYLTQDPANRPYELFLNMVGQHFDNIWVYYKDVTNRFDADNNLNKGISKDLVADALKGFGIKLYTNTNTSDNIYYSMLGINPDGTLTPPTGSDLTQYYIPFAANGFNVVPEAISTGSETPYTASATIPGEDITKEFYKRLYHNLPYLLKTKGTERGLRALINCYGIPDTILKIKEFGGSDKLYTTPDLIETRHTLAYYNSGSSNIRVPWAPLNYYNVITGSTAILPDTIEFKFKTTGLPDSEHITQSVFEVTRGGTTSFGVSLTYDSSSAVPSSSYENYGKLKFVMRSGGSLVGSTDIELPFYDPNLWWNVLLKREVGDGQAQSNSTLNTYTIYVKSAGYAEEGSGEIAFEASRSFQGTSAVNSSWNTYITTSFDNIFCGYLGGTDGNLCPSGVRFQGYFQEFRYWATPLTQDVFDEHVLNSTSYRSNTVTGSLFELAFRLPLGNNLNIPYKTTGSVVVNQKDYQLYELGIAQVDSTAGLTSYHPAATGTIYIPNTGTTVSKIDSFVAAGSTFSYGVFGEGTDRYFQPFEVTEIIATPSTGINQRVNNKVTIAEKDDLEETLLSPYTSIQKPNLDFNRNSPDIEVGFSPVDSIDLDITNQLGYFNIDEYIGAPADQYTTEYEDLTLLRDTYFQKYTPQTDSTYVQNRWWTKSFNIADFIKLLKYYDNSLFKMIKDFVPARANLSTGIIVKPHVLERSKYQRFEPITERENNLSGSIEMVEISGSNPEDTYLNTAYTQSFVTQYGIGTRIQNDLREPFTGEFSGSQIQGTTGYFPQIEYDDAFGVYITYQVVETPTGGEIRVPVLTTISASYTSSIDPLENNVSQSRSTYQLLTTDYSYNVNVPVNIDLIEEALYYFPYTPLNDLVKFSNTSTINVGDDLGMGGIVAYILQPGDPEYDSNYLRGFVVADDGTGLPAVIADNIEWSQNSIATNATSSALMAGDNNTTLIVGVDTKAAAAKAARTYKRTTDPNWYLPSLDELTEIYNNFPGVHENREYWTSTEVNSTNAYTVNLSTGASTSTAKSDTSGKVFAIKYFSYGPPPEPTYWPFAEINDYNYAAFARVNPRYEGSRITSYTYSTYTPASTVWQGDSSYGKTAVIDKIKTKYAYVKDIYPPTILLPRRSNAQIKYLVDNEENTLNLTKVNTNLFDVQNIFKTGETIEIALFDYEPANPDVQTLTNNKTLQLYEGGWRYAPIVYNITPDPKLLYTYATPFFSSSVVSLPTSYWMYSSDTNFWNVFTLGIGEDVTPGPTVYRPTRNGPAYVSITASAIVNSSGNLVFSGYTSTVDVTITALLALASNPSYPVSITFTIPSGSTPPWSSSIEFTPPLTPVWVDGAYVVWNLEPTIPSGLGQLATGQGGSTTVTNYYTTASDANPDWYAVTTRLIKMSATQSLGAVYGNAIQTFSGSEYPTYIDNDVPLETPVFPIELLPGDLIKFYSPTSQWSEEEEYRVLDAGVQTDTTGSFIYITLDRDLNPAVTDSSTIPGSISKYIALKHVPDETNLIIRYAPQAAVTQDGLIYPQYIEQATKDNSGNVLQSLKANNLID